MNMYIIYRISSLKLTIVVNIQNPMPHLTIKTGKF